MRVAGIGFRAAAPLASLAAALAEVEARGGRAEALATLAVKAGADALQALARARGLPVLALPDLAGINTPTLSPRVQARFGTGSLAEAAALAGAGPGAHLTVARIATPDGMATAAMAEAPSPRPIGDIA
ncbi:cobalamin biosynthesis protein [Gemmobacter caeruleus]|uniref:cobalamin biosynthesis protein n=1 Tax=Gemmobacter caeruleus TaxID=2595004 RepID=UPI0011EF0D8C|nr:cobalamin biosynthesis protein [Gemmobacter caeruleus]